MNLTPAFKTETIGIIAQRAWLSKTIADFLHLFHAARLARMKRGDFLINIAGVLTGRAPLTPLNPHATSPIAPAAIS